MQLTLWKTIAEVAELHPRKKALLYKKNQKRYSGVTYREIIKRMRQFGSGLLNLGLGKGDKVAILSYNRPEWVIADLGCQYIGAVTVPIHTTLSPKIIAYILNHCEAKVLVVSDLILLEKTMAHERDLRHLVKIIYIGSEEYNDPHHKIMSWNYFLKLGKKVSLDPHFEASYQDVASIVYTSGTTGLPKGVIFAHYNFLSNIQGALSYIPVTSKDVFLSYLPLSHILERTAGYYCPLSRGATIAYAESMKTLSTNMKEIRPTIMISVPRLFEKAYERILANVNTGSASKKKIFYWALKQTEHGWKNKLADRLVFRKIRKALGGRLRLTISGGASLNERIARFFHRIGINIFEGYGLTETSPVLTVNKENKCKFGSVGIVLPGVELKIEEDKEIIVRGPNIMQGYFQDPQATADAIDEAGWFHTGDLGFIDFNGFLYIIGRKKEMMVTSGGKNIWPEVIEKLLNNDTYITQSMVIGHKFKYLSALIIPDWEQILQYAKENNLQFANYEDLSKSPEILHLMRSSIDVATIDLPDYEKIVSFTLLINEFSQDKDELTPTLKLRRSTIEKHYEKDIAAMYI